MKATETKLKGCYILEAPFYEDERGYLTVAYSEEQFNAAIGLKVSFVQDNQSFSKKGVIRALHYQRGVYSQAKLVRVLSGTVLDVAVDLRKDSPTFGAHIAIELSDKNRKQLFIPRGFAHGFAVLSEKAEFLYKCDNYYHKEAEGGISYNDPTLNIDWKLPENIRLVSERDSLLPPFEAALL